MEPYILDTLPAAPALGVVLITVLGMIFGGLSFVLNNLALSSVLVVSLPLLLL